MTNLFLAFLLILGMIQLSLCFDLPKRPLKTAQSTKVASYHASSRLARYSRKYRVLVSMASESSEQGKFDPAAWINPNTRGGVIGMEDTKVGAYVGAIFVLLSNVAWASTYVFRVANKDMTYAKQLRDYENAVLQKRLDELADEEINALMEEIEQEKEDEKARNNDLQKATDLLTKATAWRSKRMPVLKEEFIDEFIQGKAYVHGTDKEGRIKE
eukprot:gene27993-33804_t